MPITPLPGQKLPEQPSQMFELGRTLVRTVNGVALDAARYSIYFAGTRILPIERRIRHGVEDIAFSSIAVARSLGSRAISLHNQIIEEEYKDSNEPITIIDDRRAS